MLLNVGGSLKSASNAQPLQLYINYSPTKNKDWLLRAGQTYTLRYRLLVFNGRYTQTQAERN